MHSSRHPLGILAGALLSATTVAAPPHLVIYVSDDHSQFDSSLYGNANIRTANFEKLAADGMTFTHAFVASPSCAPSRAAMLTGLMPARNRAEASHAVPRPGTHYLVEDLRKAGYEVVAFGKVATVTRSEESALTPPGREHPTSRCTTG